MLIDIFYHLLLIIGQYTFLGGLKFGYEIFDLSRVDAKISGCRADGELILDDDDKL